MNFHSDKYTKSCVMRKIKNPWLHKEGYNCFGCAPDNPNGLHMEFFEDGDEVLCFWRPQNNYQGWIGVIHGGIVSTLIDEAAYWLVARKLQAAAMTARLNVEFRKQLSSSETQITVRAKLQNFRHQLATVHVDVENSHGEVCARGEALYFVLTQEKSREMGFEKCDVEGDNLLPF